MMTSKDTTENYINNFLDNIEENHESFIKAISHLEDVKESYKPFAYLFDYEIAKIYHYYFDDLKNGEKFYLKALKAITNDDNTKGEIYFCIGEVLSSLKEYQQSNEYFNLCLGFFSKKNDENSIRYFNYSLLGIGSNYEDDGDFKKALDYYRKVVQKSKDTKFTGIAHYYISSLYHYKISNTENALKFAQEAEQLIKEEIYQISNYQLLSTIYLAKDDFEQAIYSLNIILEKYPDFEYISDIYQSLGQVYCIWHKEEKGIEFFKKAKENLSKNRRDYYINVISIKYRLAMAYEGKGELSTAFDLNNEILEQYSFSKYDLILPLKNQGRVLQKMGNILDGYSVLKDGLIEYEKSSFFNKNNEEYIEALELKNELYKKLPIGNRLIEKLKNSN